MRETAYRAWTEFKTMVDVPTINFATSEALMPDGEWYKVTLMQWTGLVDKAGTRIYEGDIVRQGEQFMWKLEWDYSELAQLNTDEVEIVGNIYENKDLLK